MTGLAASLAGGGLALEADREPGGICRSHPVTGAWGEWPFDYGGGHWVFGGDALLNAFLARFGEWRQYRRRSAVWLPDLEVLAPFPVQNNLYALPRDLASVIWAEMRQASAEKPAVLSEWLSATFGPTLNGLFFRPFHDLYTAGLTESIAADDLFKTPVDLSAVERGLGGQSPDAGYNSAFLYPAGGLSAFARRLAEEGRVRTGSRIRHIELSSRAVELDDGREIGYDRMICTLPLHAALQIAGHGGACDPHTSVLVVNIGARKGPRCPEAHWVYFPRSGAGFHRVGFYSNVDSRFVPEARGDLASLYVERAFPAGAAPTPGEVDAYERAVVRELQSMGYIEDVDVVSPHWLEVAYTWRRPGSRWREESVDMLARHGVHAAGRYARWRFQGIAESLREGMLAGSLLRARR